MKGWGWRLPFGCCGCRTETKTYARKSSTETKRNASCNRTKTDARKDRQMLDELDELDVKDVTDGLR